MYTEFGSADAQTVKIWAKMLFREAIHKTWIRRLLGTGENAILQRITELEKNAGDEVKYDLLLQMTQNGVEGDATLEGFEEALTFVQDSVKIDQRRIGHAFRRMTQQRTVHDLRTAARNNLSDRFAELYDYIMFAQLAGTVGDGGGGVSPFLPLSVAQHGGNTLVDPATSDTNHRINKAGETFRTDHIDIAVERAQTISPLIRPAKFEGEELYVLIVHPICITDLRTNVTASFWRDIVAQALIGKDNPLFTGAVGRWNNVIIHQSTRIPRTGNTAHCLFLGAQAGVALWGNAYSKLDQGGGMGSDNLMSWWERDADYGNERGVAAGAIFGMKPSTFDVGGVTDARLGMIRVDISAAAHS